DRWQDPRLLHAGAGRVARSRVPHGWLAIGPQQCVRWRQRVGALSQSWSLLGGVRRIVLPPPVVARSISGANGVWRLGTPARPLDGAADVRANHVEPRRQ